MVPEPKPSKPQCYDISGGEPGSDEPTRDLNLEADVVVQVGAQVINPDGFVGHVHEVWQDTSGDVLYRVVYPDGDVEDMDHRELLIATRCPTFEVVE